MLGVSAAEHRRRYLHNVEQPSNVKCEVSYKIMCNLKRYGATLQYEMPVPYNTVLDVL